MPAVLQPDGLLYARSRGFDRSCPRTVLRSAYRASTHFGDRTYLRRRCCAGRVDHRRRRGREPALPGCSIGTRSEILVLIHANGEIVGEIDIDSCEPAAFGPKDRIFLEERAAFVGGFIERIQTVPSGSKW